MPNPVPFSELHQVEIFGLTILEPSTVLSSLAMTVVCVVACCRSLPFRHRRIAALTIAFLVFMGLATAIGGILGHGVLYKTGMAGKLPGWICGIIALALYERGVMYRLEGLVSEKLLSGLLWLNIAGLVIFVGLTIFFLSFEISQYQAVYSLLLMTGTMEVYIFSKTRNVGSRYVFWAIALAVAAALVHLSGFGLGVWFQANDISHIPMGACIWFLYLAMAKSGFSKASRG